MSAKFEVIRLAVNQADLKMSINVYRLIKKLALKEEYYVKILKEYMYLVII